MKFVVALLAIASAVMAAPPPLVNVETRDLTARQSVGAEQPAMTTPNGDIIPFDAENVPVEAQEILEDE